MKYIDLNETNKKKIVLDQGGKYRVVFFNYIGKVEVVLEEENIDLEIFGLYIGSKNQNYDLDVVQHHKEANSRSKLLVRGVFFQKTKFNYSATVKIENNAENTKASQKNENIILSDEVEINAKPFLEIDNDNVECSHSSVSGRLDKKEIFYLQTRGLDKLQSKKTLIRGFIKDIRDKFSQKDKIQIPEIKF